MGLADLKMKNQDLSFGLVKFYTSIQYQSGESKEMGTCLSLVFVGEVLSADIKVGVCQCIENSQPGNLLKAQRKKKKNKDSGASFLRGQEDE